MKIHGRKIQGPNVEYIVFPRPDGDVIFKAQAVLDTKRFDELVPKPKPGKKVVPGKGTIDDFDCVHYKSEVEQYSKKRWAFLVLESLKETDGLEWETVDHNNPNTWPNWEQELKDSGFTETEIQYLQVGISTANSLNQEKLEEARKRFLASQLVGLKQ